jgi:hypothetical protein
MIRLFYALMLTALLGMVVVGLASTLAMLAVWPVGAGIMVVLVLIALAMTSLLAQMWRTER